jgi:ribosomal protein S18 acetylase RimI-like enzyme
MTEPTIRPARLDDAESLHEHCDPDSSLDDVRAYLAWCLRQMEKKRMVRLVAEVGGQAVGNAQLTVWRQTGEIGSLVVGRGFRRRGLARRLVGDLIEHAKRLGLDAVELETRSDRPFPLAFYRSLGFGIVAEKKGLSPLVFPAPVVRLRLLL